MLTSERPRELRTSYCAAMAEIVNEISAKDASPEGAVARRRVLRVLGVTVAGEDPPVAEDRLRSVVAEYVVALKGVIRSFRVENAEAEHQQVAVELEAALGGLL